MLLLTACSQLNTALDDTSEQLQIAEDSTQLSITPESDPFKINYDDYPVTENIWDRVRSGFAFADANDNPRLTAELNWYSKHNTYLDRVAERAEPFLYFILEEAEKRGLPTELALLPIVESAFQPFAYSHGRAAGIWQFIPSTGRIYGLKQNWWYDGRRDVHASTMAALKYLENLNREFKGNWLHALAAYNSGSGTVRKAIRKNKRRGKPTDFWSLKLPKETQAYVPKLLALKRIVANPQNYNVSLRCIADEPYFSQVDIDSQIDLAMAAELADIDMETLYRLNPGYNRWATDPKGPHKLLLPLEKVELFNENLAQTEPSSRIKWKRHKIREGETLSHVADRYALSVDDIKRVNNLRTNNIRQGKYLIIPVSSKKLSDYNLTAYQRKKTLQNIRRKGTKIVHIVQPGDSFWEISRRYNVNTKSLARWNGMAVRDPLRAGQKLVVWTKKALSPANTSASLGGNTIRTISYRVRNGDSLYRIAQRFNVGIRDLHRWNVIKGKILKPGQMLKLHVDITNQAEG
ncbi:MAG: LysM peptidoglycan-binding domain-containing protein [Gammaproteobacteria bacterium]|nr:LysM peptidoglycan-binding domain-containing protein [Gammaproteobacteria bacterium]MCW8909906.1 LysM peptidoglycan-binding domain-containing protein [Gammaproteobacteria bacterium]MCW9003789.1 LysM peptidoglycan-binding domain-containing protein [Gammaproteobacteria bacterium]MCW9055358.1 LysM peptidoglycan-binding domain-containing protein [Gammaproteobacteria bacterium]